MKAAIQTLPRMNLMMMKSSISCLNLSWVKIRKKRMRKSMIKN